MDSSVAAGLFLTSERLSLRCLAVVTRDEAAGVEGELTFLNKVVRSATFKAAVVLYLKLVLLIRELLTEV